jgi:hypothetical protein
MKEFYFNSANDMLLIEDLKIGSVTRFDQMPRSFFISIDAKIKEQFSEVHAELCTLIGNVGCEYGRVYQFCACNFSTRDGNPDIDDDGNFILERVSCPIRHTCKRITCKAKVSGKVSAREIEVINLFVKGFSEEEIGERLFISKSTVHNHTNHIYTKLGFTGMANPDRLLAVYAVKNKIVN